MPVTDPEQEPLVSVVTPVYNGADYLAECIESVLAQEYQNWEYIIADNCSTDGSLEIAQSFAKRNPRVRVHSNDRFLGLAENWNHALRHISPQSKYCKVVHADDLLFPECISRMMAVAEKNPSVGIVGAYSLYGDRVKPEGLPYPTRIIPGRDVCRSMLMGGPNVFGSPTVTMIRSDIVRRRDTFYDEDKVYLDMAVCFDVLQHYDFGFVYQVLTFTRLHEKSVTSSMYSPMRLHKLGKLQVTKAYGPVFLNRRECEARLAEELAGYYKVLSRHILRRNERGFWSYHRDALNQLGEPLRYRRLARAWLLHLIDRLSNPGATIRGQLRARLRFS